MKIKEAAQLAKTVLTDRRTLIVAVMTAANMAVSIAMPRAVAQKIVTTSQQTLGAGAAFLAAPMIVTIVPSAPAAKPATKSQSAQPT